MLIDEVMTAAEAAKRWHVGVSTIRQACTGYKGGPPRFSREESRQSGSTWLVTLAGMERLYGPEPK
ncbi:helix-turn-helix domain-containing protein [Acidaminococcus timonensis]|jgi:hypothetical protein|uniref:helix-turn-helix domain-containing protein n=1 Tax=Acidaminococcus timonensis TaxID=1871002 RepID=UPI00345DA211